MPYSAPLEDWAGGLPPKIDRTFNLHQFPPDEFNGAAVCATTVPVARLPQIHLVCSTERRRSSKVHKDHHQGLPEAMFQRETGPL